LRADAEALAKAWGITDPAMVDLIVRISLTPGGLRNTTYALELAVMIAKAKSSRCALTICKTHGRKIPGGVCCDPVVAHRFAARGRGARADRAGCFEQLRDFIICIVAMVLGWWKSPWYWPWASRRRRDVSIRQPTRDQRRRARGWKPRAPRICAALMPMSWLP
jgi:hypothetical protein